MLVRDDRREQRLKPLAYTVLATLTLALLVVLAVRGLWLASALGLALTVLGFGLRARNRRAVAVVEAMVRHQRTTEAWPIRGKIALWPFWGKVALCAAAIIATVLILAVR